MVKEHERSGSKAGPGEHDDTVLQVVAEAPPEALSQELRDPPGREDQAAGEAELRAPARAGELLERARRAEHELSLLSSIVRITAVQGVDEALDSVVRMAHQVIDADIVYLTVLLPAEDRFQVRAATGTRSPGFQVGFSSGGDVGIAGRVRRTWRSFWTADYVHSEHIVHAADVDGPMQAEGIVSMLGVPLVAGDRFLGTLNVADRARRNFTAEDIKVLEAFGDHAAIALENARLYEQSQQSLAELQEAYRTIEAAITQHEALNRLVLTGGDVASVGELLARELGGSLAVLDRHNDVASTHPGQHADPAPVDRASTPDLEEWVQASSASGGCITARTAEGTTVHVMALATGTTYRGALVLSARQPLSPMGIRTLEHGAHIATLSVLARDAVADAEARARGDLLGQLLSSDGPPAPHVVLQCRAQGVDVENLNAVVVVDVEEGRRHRAITSLDQLVRGEGGLAGSVRGLPVVLVATTDSSRTAEQIHQHLKGTVKKPLLVACALKSEPQESMEVTFTMARRCVELLSAMGVSDGATAAEELGMYATLFDPRKQSQLTSFLRQNLGPVLDYDQQHQTELRETLSCFFAHSNNAAQTARALHIHPNTLSKRLERLGHLLGPHWQEVDHSLRLRVASRLVELSQRLT